MTHSVVIAEGELRWQFSASGGPGGQHANTSNTRAEVSFDVESSESLGPVQRARIIAKLGPTVRVTAADTRSQLRNRELAARRLAIMLGDALKVERIRRPTKPSKAAKARRLDAKSQHSDRKAARRRPAPDD